MSTALVIGIVNGGFLVLAALVGRSKLEAIHVLVNNRLDEALAKIAELEGKKGPPVPPAV